MNKKILGLCLLLGSCAKTPRLQNGDEILEVNGIPVSEKERVVKSLEPEPGGTGREVTFKVKDKDGNVYTKVVGQPTNPAEAVTAPKLEPKVMVKKQKSSPTKKPK